MVKCLCIVPRLLRLMLNGTEHENGEEVDEGTGSVFKQPVHKPQLESLCLARVVSSICHA